MIRDFLPNGVNFLEKERLCHNYSPTTKVVWSLKAFVLPFRLHVEIFDIFYLKTTEGFKNCGDL